VNSGGVVFFALFNSLGKNGLPKEEAAVIKFAASKMATQAELLGYEFARLLGVQTPQVFANSQ
jgi:atypical dual specificity phosphatase